MKLHPHEGFLNSASVKYLKGQVLQQLGWVWLKQLWALWTHMYMVGVGPGQTLSCLHSSHSRSRCTATADLGCDLNGSVPVAWWKNCLRVTRAAYPHQGWDWEQCQQQVILWAHTMGERGQNGAHSQLVNSSREGLLSGFTPSGTALIPPTLHYRSEIQLRNRSKGLYSNN